MALLSVLMPIGEKLAVLGLCCRGRVSRSAEARRSQQKEESVNIFVSNVARERQISSIIQETGVLCDGQRQTNNHCYTL
jgi:hypothetical protein